MLNWVLLGITILCLIPAARYGWLASAYANPRDRWRRALWLGSLAPASAFEPEGRALQLRSRWFGLAALSAFTLWAFLH